MSTFQTPSNHTSSPSTSTSAFDETHFQSPTLTLFSSPLPIYLFATIFVCICVVCQSICSKCLQTRLFAMPQKFKKLRNLTRHPLPISPDRVVCYMRAMSRNKGCIMWHTTLNLLCWATGQVVSGIVNCVRHCPLAYSACHIMTYTCEDMAILQPVTLEPVSSEDKATLEARASAYETAHPPHTTVFYYVREIETHGFK